MFQIMQMHGWNITDVMSTGVMAPSKENGRLLILTDQTRWIGGVVYWSAPVEYLGNKV